MGLQIISEREGFILDPYAVIGIRVFADLVKMVEENFQNKKKHLYCIFVKREDL